MTTTLHQGSFVSVVCRHTGCPDVSVEWIVPATLVEQAGPADLGKRITGNLAVVNGTDGVCPSCGHERSIVFEHALKVKLACPECEATKVVLGDVDVDMTPEGQLNGGFRSLVKSDQDCLVCANEDGVMEMEVVGPVWDALEPDYGSVSVAEERAQLSQADQTLLTLVPLVRLQCQNPSCSHILWAPGQWDLFTTEPKVRPVPAFRRVACGRCAHPVMKAVGYRVL